MVQRPVAQTLLSVLPSVFPSALPRCLAGPLPTRTVKSDCATGLVPPTLLSLLFPLTGAP